MAGEQLSLPPFPPLVADKFWWTGSLVVPAWIGYYSWKPLMIETWEPMEDVLVARGYTRESWVREHTGSGDGRFELNVEWDAAEDGPLQPTERQKEVFRRFLEEQDAVSKRVLSAVDEYVSQYRDDWYLEIYNDDEEVKKHLAGLTGLDQYRKLMRPGSIFILPEEKRGGDCLGFTFECAWDEEHGCGVLTRFGEVLKVGQSDVAF